MCVSEYGCGKCVCMSLVVLLCDRQHSHNVNHNFFTSASTLESSLLNAPTSSSVSSQKLHNFVCVNGQREIECVCVCVCVCRHHLKRPLLKQAWILW